jgi:hypothetical protein
MGYRHIEKFKQQDAQDGASMVVGVSSCMARRECNLQIMAEVESSVPMDVGCLVSPSDMICGQVGEDL